MADISTCTDVGKWKWNESGFRPPLCTYRLNWARRTSWGWWDDWDDTVLQTQNSKFEPWRSEAEYATSRSRRLPTILTALMWEHSTDRKIHNDYLKVGRKVLLLPSQYPCKQTSKWINARSLRPPVCKYRQNWDKRNSWACWDEADDITHPLPRLQI